MRASDVHEATTTTFSCFIFVKFRYLDIYPELSHESVTAVEAAAPSQSGMVLGCSAVLKPGVVPSPGLGAKLVSKQVTEL